MTADRRFAKDVARELDRRRSRRRLMFLTAALGLIILAVMYLRCGSGWGLGGTGGGAGDGTGTTATSDAGMHRCWLRVSAGGLTVDGKTTTQEHAVDVCRHTPGGADIIITGDARERDAINLKAALEAAKVKPIVVHERTH